MTDTKKKSIIIIIIAAVLVLIAIVSGIWLVNNARYKEFVLTDRLAQKVFFTKISRNYDNQIIQNQLKKRAAMDDTNISKIKVNDDGVVVFLTESQVENCKSATIEEINRYKKESVFVSEDYRKIIIDNADDPVRTLNSTTILLDLCLFVQILDNTSGHDACLDLIIIEGEEQIYKITWPKEKVDFTYTEGTSKYRVEYGSSLDVE